MADVSSHWVGWPLASPLPSALLLVSLVLVALLTVACYRPHLKNSVKRGALVTRFARERSSMFVPLLQKSGLTTEFEGYLVTADPKLAEHLLKTKAHTELRSRWYVLSGYLLPHLHGVLNMHGPVWKAHTRALAPLFSARNIAKHLKHMHEVATRHARAWTHGIAAVNGRLDMAEYTKQLQLLETSGSNKSSAMSNGVVGVNKLVTGGPDLLDAVRGISMEILLRWAYGLQPNTEFSSQISAELFEYGRLVSSLAQKPLQVLCNYAALYACGRRIRALTEQIIEAKREQATGANSSANSADNIENNSINAGNRDEDIDGVLLMLRAGLPSGEIAAEVNHVHGAHKAAGFLMAHAIHELGQTARYNAQNSDNTMNISDASGAWWADRMRAEIIRVYGMEGVPSRDHMMTSLNSAANGNNAIAAAAGLPISRAVILECCRRHAVSLGVVRRTGAPLEVDGVRIPSGTEIILILEALHSLPAFWLRAAEFRPERWMGKGLLQEALRLQAGAVVGVGDMREGQGDTAEAGSAPAFVIDGITIDCNSAVVGTALSAMEAGSRDATGTSTHSVGEDEAGTEGVFKIGSAQDVAARTPPPRGDAAEFGIRPPAYSFEPFLTGSRMCNGKVLAETEVLVVLAAILRVAVVQTQLEYLAHINDVPFGCPPNVASKMRKMWKLPETHSSTTGNILVQEPSADGVTAGSIRIVKDYAGPMDILLADNMYSSIEGSVAFTAVPLS